MVCQSEPPPCEIVSMSRDTFDQLESRLTARGAQGVLEELARHLTEERKYHELFDVLLMRSRHALGLPVVLTTPLDDLSEPVRSQVETAYLDSCREVGAHLLGEGKLREAWMYLRPLGDKQLV